MKKVKFYFVTFLILTVSAVSAQSSKGKVTKNKTAKTAYKARTTFIVKGMTCQGCVNSVKHTFGSIDGVKNYDVNLDKGKAVVKFDPKITNIKKIENKFKGTPYKVFEQKTKSKKALKSKD